jgi:GDPmannose 4,6-dehydratase
MKTALITGITGQTGSYMAEKLLGEGYDVHGIIRRSSTISTQRIDHLYTDPHEKGPLTLHYGDLADATGLDRIIMEVEPDEIYNFGAQSHVRVSFEQPIYTVDCVGTGCLRMLEATRSLNRKKPVKFYQASSSEMFGSSPPPQNESTPFKPVSPYACAKTMAYQLVANYRESYNLFACNGILFNHESPRRGETFVTRKITIAATKIHRGQQDKLYLGNLDAKRDWGYAGDYVDAIYKMMQHDSPDDYVVATGETHSVREFLAEAFGYYDLDWSDYVVIDKRYYRPTEVDVLCGDYFKARNILGWEPETSFVDLVDMMMRAELKKSILK